MTTIYGTTDKEMIERIIGNYVGDGDYTVIIDNTRGSIFIEEVREEQDKHYPHDLETGEPLKLKGGK